MNMTISPITFNSKVPIRQTDSFLIKGPAPTVKDLLCLKKKGVTQIFDFRHYGFKGHKFVEKFMCKFLGIDYNRIACSFFDNGGFNLEDFNTVSQRILQNGKNGNKTYIHCNSGRHRTILMSMFYEITRGKTLENAKKIYPKTFELRKKIILNNKEYQNQFNDRKLVNLKKYNFYHNFYAKINNKILLSTQNAKRKFEDML